MESKKEYRIWRTYDGKFTALNRKGKLTTWSLATGKVMYTRDLNKWSKKHSKVMKLRILENTDPRYNKKFKCEY
jgi:hypothetical protein